MAMPVKYIPPKDPNEKRLQQIQSALTEVLRSYILEDTKLQEAVTQSIATMRPLLKLARDANQGATVMTEAASHQLKDGGYTKGPKNL